MVNDIIAALGCKHINEYRLICMRSRNAAANAYARIWNLPGIWQKALGVGAFYIIEVLSQHFDKLPREEKEKVLIHELLHIPKTFSGALRPHRGKVPINAKTVEQLHKIYLQKKREMPSAQAGKLEIAEEMF
jgi:predicted metallopeptidase